ncbi:MAG TPA: RNA polymerase sigma factor [Bryobacteraceae bacterium]|nr:RNA polymerase sigma factor [Bryobacteraceae bacterium]
MLRVFAKRERQPTGYERIFLSRYDQIFAWARQLTKGNEAEAEDLVQDAFIDFIHSRPDLSAVRNLDAFLYTIIRNIHRSQLQKHLRRRDLLLTAVDYDSAELGLRAAGQARMVEIREQLHRVCQFACDRKRSSKAGSLLILRFFHSYYPSEIAAIARWDRATVDARLGLVRREARAYVEGPDRLRSIDSPSRPSAVPEPVAFESEAILGELKTRIFLAAEGACLSDSRIRALYDNRKMESPDRGFLSHLVSCPRCLDVVNGVLGLDNSSQRGFGESDGPKPVPRGKPSNRRANIAKWKRSATGILEHYPRQLTVVVNGSELAWQTIASDHNEFSVRLPQDEPVDFIEVFSEQEIRLLSLAVPDQPAGVNSEFRNQVFLSDNRSLELVLRFDTLGQEVHVCYREQARNEAVAPVRDPLSPAAVRPRWRFAFRPQLAFLAIPLLIAAALFLTPNRETSASAAVLLMKTQASERTAAAQTGRVVHRSLRLEERPRGRAEVLNRRRVEIWKDGHNNAATRRLYDERGALLAVSDESNTIRPTSGADVWKYEPSAENFELLAGDLSDVKVSANSDSVELDTPFAGVTIEKASWHTSAGFVVLGEREYLFTETAFELIRPENSPLAEPVPMTENHVDTSSLPTPGTATPPSAKPHLEDVELECRYELHRLGSDVGAPIGVRREDSPVPSVVVSGVVPSEQRRREIQNALASLGSVRFELKTEDELVLEAPPPAQSSTEIRMASARSPIEKQLLEFFKHPADVERFTRDILTSNEELMAHAWALHRLSDRYPSQSLASLNPDSQHKLQEMIADHRRDVRRALGELSARIEPVLHVFAEPEPAPETSQPLFESAQRVEQYVIALVSGSGPKGAVAQEHPEVAARELLAAIQITAISAK